jgi:hypothetical protein
MRCYRIDIGVTIGDRIRNNVIIEIDRERERERKIERERERE